MTRIGHPGVLLLLAAAAAAPAGAGQAVFFEDGRALRVEGMRREADVVHLALEGGGTIVVPAWRVVGTQELAGTVTRGTSGGRTSALEGWRGVAGPFADPIARAAEVHRLDPVLLTAIAETESAFDPRAVSPKGALGLLQLMPETARRFGVRDVFDVSENVEGGARYLRWLLERFEGDTELALAGYNAGEAAVDRFRGIPPYRETREYVDRVLAGAARIRGEATARRERENSTEPTLASNP